MPVGQLGKEGKKESLGNPKEGGPGGKAEDTPQWVEGACWAETGHSKMKITQGLDPIFH